MDQQSEVSRLFEAAVRALVDERDFQNVHIDRYSTGEIRSYSTLAEEISALHEEGFPDGEDPGWLSVKQLYRPVRGQWTVVTGIPGHGKSAWLDALMINLVNRAGWKFGVFSAENHPVTLHAAKLLANYTGFPFHPGPNVRLSKSDIGHAIKRLDDHFFFLDPEEQHLNLDALLDMAQYLKNTKQIDGLVLDPWNEIEQSRKEWESEPDYINRSLTKIRRFARKQNIHIWVVAHPTKLYRDKEGNTPKPGLYDISGSAHWRNKADFGICVWRDLEAEINGVHGPTEIQVLKVRFSLYGKIGRAKLHFDRTTGRYFES